VACTIGNECQAATIYAASSDHRKVLYIIARSGGWATISRVDGWYSDAG